MSISSIFSHISACKGVWVPILALLVPLWLAVDYDPELEKESKCAYVIIVMAVLWLTEAIPIPVTALMPIFMFPLLGVATAKTISSSYVTDTTMLFLGGLIIAVALEETGLHVRISLCVMRIVGAEPMFLMAGLMATTWFLSMWISNTAATSMMIPIINAVIKTVRDIRAKTAEEEMHENNGLEMDGVDGTPNGDRKFSGEVNKAYESQESVNSQGKYTVNTDNVDVNVESGIDHGDTPEMRRLAKGFALSVAYGANIGGIATLTGTPPNLVLKDRADKLYADYGNGMESEISFAKWMGFAFPLSLLCAILGWIWLVIIFLRCGCFKKGNPKHKQAINQTIREQFKTLGMITMAEVQVLVVFIVLVFLWLFRAPPNIDGWGNAAFLKKGHVSDSTACILLSVLLFILPKEKPRIFCWHSEGLPKYTPILNWQVVGQKLPWGVIVLLGGGFALAKASGESGLSAWVGNELSVFADQEDWVLNLIIACIVAGATEVTSNTATATLLMPILESLGISIGVHPLYLMITATVACSFAFMLPVATPPNAIVFSTGYLSIPDMALAGLPMNIIAVLALTLAINTWGTSMYNLGETPEMFVNVTSTI